MSTGTELWRRLWFCVAACLLLTALCPAAAANVDPANKYAWGQNVGWANFAPTNGGVTVHFDGTSGYLTGTVWGENIGWIKLGDNSGGPYNNNSPADWGVNLDGSGSLSGYAWGENVGWIKFATAYSQVTIDQTVGRFDGYAWGENIGWIRFKGSVSNYNVRTLAFDRQPLGTPNWWLDLHGVGEQHEDGDGVPAWQEYVSDTDPRNAESYFHLTAISSRPSVRAYFPSSSRRYYTLQRLDDLPAGVWSNVPGQIGLQGTSGLDWLQDANAGLRQFYRVEVKDSP